MFNYSKYFNVFFPLNCTQNHINHTEISNSTLSRSLRCLTRNTSLTFTDYLTAVPIANSVTRPLILSLQAGPGLTFAFVLNLFLKQRCKHFFEMPIFWLYLNVRFLHVSLGFWHKNYAFRLFRNEHCNKCHN